MKSMRLAFAALLILALLLFPAVRPGLADDFADIPVRHAEVDGATLGYRVLGQGQPLLLITGYGATMDVWDSTLVRDLAQSFTVILFDNRGMGYSTASDAPFTQSLFARDAVGVLDALGIAQVHVLGWSMGGMIAQEMASSVPKRVQRLVLYATASDSNAITPVLDRLGTLKPQELMTMMFPRPWLDKHPGIFQQLPSPTRPAATEAIIRQRKAIDHWPGVTDRLKTIHAPVLLLVGDDDFITPPALSRTMLGQLADARMKRFALCGHWMMYQIPGQLARTIKTFLLPGATSEN